MSRKHKLRNAPHLFSLFDRPMVSEILNKVREAPIEHNMVVVSYDDEGYCLFNVLIDTPELLHVEFISTAK